MAYSKARYEPWKTDNEKRAMHWRPPPVKWLVITESPPCPDEDEWDGPPFIYRLRENGNNILAGALACGFFGEHALGWDYRRRLTELRNMNAGIIDVCEYPVNHLDDKERLAEAIGALEGEFFERLDGLKPANLIILGSQKKGKYAYEVRRSLPTCIETILRNKEPISLPHQGNFERCWRGIRKCFLESQKSKSPANPTA